MTRYTIMPEFGGAYGWVNEDGTEALGPKHADVTGWRGGHPISQALHNAFASWQDTFELGRQDFFPQGNEVDWTKFHAQGLALTRRLKAELGNSARVFYELSSAAPEYPRGERYELLRDGTRIRWPRIWRARSIHPTPAPAKLISGGQTGVDRAALDWAMGRGIAHGGWCPKGRRSNDGVLPDRYRLLETDSPGYAARTHRNVETATTTLVLIEGPLVGGSLLTAKLAERLGMRYAVFQLNGGTDDLLATGIRGWLVDEDCACLNIAGPSEERCPGIFQRVMALLDRSFPRCSD